MRDYDFGNFLRELRMRQNLSQFQLGSLVGVTEKAVSKWENGTSKPRTAILYKLSEIMGVTADELLAARYRYREEEKEVSAMRTEFRDELFGKLTEKYGWPTDMRVHNRYLSEIHYMNANDEWKKLILLLRRLRTRADEKGEHIRINGALSGSSFLLYIMGVTEIDPLPPNYFCPDCKKIEFSRDVRCGWDLVPKKCSCGCEFERGGLDIPISGAAEHYMSNPHIDIKVSVSFYGTAREIIESELSDEKTAVLVRDSGRIAARYVILPDDSPDSGKTMSYDENHKKFTSYTGIMIHCITELDRYRLLEEATNTSFSRIPFASAELFERFLCGDHDGISEFRASFYSDITQVAKPKNIFEMIQLTGLSHGTGVWTDNAEKLLREGKTLSEVIVYQEDVFEYIRNRMADAEMYEIGWAQTFTKEVRQGKYVDGLWKTHGRQLTAIGVEPWFIESVQKIRYLFPRGFGALYVKHALTLMWYKLNYPDEFRKVMLDR